MTMAPQLSSNWKKLQSKIKQESAPAQGQKRKADDNDNDGRATSQASRQPTKKAKTVVATRHTAASKSSKPPRPRAVAPKRPPPAAAMGAVASQPSKPGPSASLALWAEDNDLSLEQVSEAYGLGTRDNAMLTATAVRPNEGLAGARAGPHGADDPDAAVRAAVGKYVAIDCEMVGVGDGGHGHALARASVVDFHGRQVYDSYVRPRERVTDWRTRISGIAPRHMAAARDFDEVQAQVAQLLRGRILVGHDLRHDLDVLMLDHPRKDIRDTARFSGFKKYGNGPKPALRVLAREILGVEIQAGQHSSIEDARVAMLLFRKYKPAFDVEHASRHPEPVLRALEPKVKTKQKKTKKKRRN